MGHARLIHAFDQLTGVMKDFAPVLKAYYNELMRQGFTSDQAMDLVLNLQDTMITELVADSKRMDSERS